MYNYEAETERQKERDSAMHGLLKSQSLFLVTASSKKATPSNYSQRVRPTGDQAFTLEPMEAILTQTSTI